MADLNHSRDALTPIVEIQGVSKTYGKAGAMVTALSDVSFRVMPGDFTAVIGPSGSGKSTLLHIMGLLDRVGSGRVVFQGREAGAMSSRERAHTRNARIGFVFQSFHLLPRLSALENVMLPLVYSGMPRKQAGKRAMAALEAVGLENRSGHKPSQLSGGECQRTAVARAVVMDPALVLADEPTGNLDRKTGSTILDLFARLQSDRGASMVIVTHDPEVAARCRDRLELEDGRVVS